MKSAMYTTMSSKGQVTIPVEMMNIEMYERNLPPYLAHDLEAWKKGVEEKSHLLDCLWGELYGSINIAEINDNLITHEQAQYLRDKYLWGKDI